MKFYPVQYIFVSPPNIEARSEVCRLAALEVANDFDDRELMGGWATTAFAVGFAPNPTHFRVERKVDQE